VTQLGDLNRLVAFKDLGFTLEQVGDLLRDGVEEVDARLRLIESEHGMYAGYVATRDASNPEIVEMPGCEVASVIHRGPMEGVGRAHQTLARWAVTQGYEFSAPARRKRSVFLEANGEDQANRVVDVQPELT
jgi:hypothetical protein